MIGVKKSESKYVDCDIIPVLIVGGLIGMVFAIIIRQTVCNWQQAEINDLALEQFIMGREVTEDEKTNNKKAGRSNAATKGQRNKAAEKKPLGRAGKKD